MVQNVSVAQTIPMKVVILDALHFSQNSAQIMHVLHRHHSNRLCCKMITLWPTFSRPTTRY